MNNTERVWKPRLQIIFLYQLAPLEFPNVVIVFNNLAECVAVKSKRKELNESHCVFPLLEFNDVTSFRFTSHRF